MEEPKTEISSTLHFSSAQFARINSDAALALTGRTQHHWSIAGPTAKSNQRVGSNSRRLPANSAIDSFLAEQTRKQAGMVDLPLEIIQRIITITLPGPLANYRSRRRFLLPLCSLHSSLRRFVQRLLFVHPVLYGPYSAALFLDTVEGNQSGFDFGGCVKSLRMDGSWREATVEDTGRLFSRLCESCDAIEEIWIHSLENVNFARFAKLSSEQPPIKSNDPC